MKELSNNKINEFFYILKNANIFNNEIFFLADDKLLDGFDDKKLRNYNNFTYTSPAYRANFQIYLINAGFS